MKLKQYSLSALALGALTFSTVAVYAKGPAPVTVTLKTAQGADAGTAVLKQEKDLCHDQAGPEGTASRRTWNPRPSERQVRSARF